jgi:outer membrane beta-barrel protein
VKIILLQLFLTVAASLHIAAPALADSGTEPVDAVADEEEDSEEDDALRDILGEPKDESAKDEQADVRSGDMDDRIGVTSESILLPEDEISKRRLIKILQRKNFLKIGRYELAPHVGFITNDPFINRYLIGAGFAYHITEVLAVEAVGTFSPDFGEGDWKPITTQLVNENKVSPDISKIVYYGNINFQFSPIYGKIALLGSNIVIFDIFGVFGTGFVHTDDDLKALQKEDEQSALNTEVQNHPTTNFGGGFRVILNKNFAARLEGRSMIYIETIDSTTLEMKQNFLLQMSASFFFPALD